MFKSDDDFQQYFKDIILNASLERSFYALVINHFLQFESFPKAFWHRVQWPVTIKCMRESIHVVDREVNDLRVYRMSDFPACLCQSTMRGASLIRGR